MSGGEVMKSIADLHNAAMELADRAIVLRQEGKDLEADSVFRTAFRKEAEAALLAQEIGIEPTRSVLHRSAATLALDCGELREAEQFISLGLSGNTPDEVAEELRDLYEQVTFSRHLRVQGLQLEPDEFQFSIHGNAVGNGIADSDEFIERVKITETLLYRTAERTLKRPFREHGRRQGGLEQDIALYISVPRAASFAVSFKIGYPEQLKLPGCDLPPTLIDEFLTCMELYSSDKDKLKNQIPDEAYFRNFMALADSMSPDGDRVKLVGFTSSKGKKERQVILKQYRPPVEERRSPRSKKTHIRVTGRLKFADDIHKQRTIQLLQKDGKSHTIAVPPGLMDDIVKPMWGQNVTVTGRMVKGRIQLEKIKGATR
jgi:hypothetical protein